MRRGGPGRSASHVLDVHVETQVGQVCEEARAAQADAAAQGGLRGGDDAHRADGCDDAVRLISAAANHKEVIVSVSSTPSIFVHGYWHGSLQAKFIVEPDAALPANPTTVFALDASHSPFLSMPKPGRGDRAAVGMSRLTHIRLCGEHPCAFCTVSRTGSSWPYIQSV